MTQIRQQVHDSKQKMKFQKISNSIVGPMIGEKVKNIRFNFALEKSYIILEALEAILAILSAITLSTGNKSFRSSSF